MAVEEGVFDIIVVGAGSAGCVVAGRLSENPALSVALVDAGGKDHTRITRIPAAVLRTMGHPRYDWRFKTEPDPTRNNRVDQIARGRVLGGSSAINGLIFVRGTKQDFDEWEALGNKGWSWQDVLPLFRRMENFESSANDSRGGLGSQPVSLPSYKHGLTDAFIASAAAAGIPYNSDYNGPSQEGIGIVQGIIRRGVRVSAFDAYIAPNLKRSNLHVLPHRRAASILFEGRKAVGIEVEKAGTRSIIRARRGVVVSLGSFNSPQLLMLSGIGDPTELSAHGISVRQSAPRVGKDLRDHTGFRLVVEVDTPTANNQAHGINVPRYLTQWLLSGKGPVGAASAEAVAFFRSRPEVERPDLQLTLFPYASDFSADGRALLPNRAMTSIGINLNYPKSHASRVELRSADPFSPPKISYRLFDDEDDLESLTDGLAIARNIIAHNDYGRHVIDRSSYPDGKAGRDADRDFVRANSRGFMHPVGSCRMGDDAAAPVAPSLEVKGMENLWVADASVFPNHISGNINATVMMIGEKAAELIRGKL